MITGIIAGVILIAVLPPAIGNGQWGVVAVAVVAALLVLGFGAATRQQDRAYGNLLRFWERGELPQDQRRRRGPPKEKSPWQNRREEKEAKKRRELFMDQRDEEFREKGRRELVDCPTCGKRSNPVCKLVRIEKEDYWQCQCPFCGAVLTKPHWRTK